MTKSKNRVFCPYVVLKSIIRNIRVIFTSSAYHHIMLITALAVSIGIIFIALDILEFPFISYDSFCSIICLGGTRHTVGVLSALFLIPLCAAKKRFGFLGALLLGISLFLLCAVHIAYMLIMRTYRFEEQIHGPIIWALAQLPVIIYGYKSFMEVKKNE
ncbi:MAG: hypothetical protein JW822_14340 [Spirochaetales bacterium]|nr:hypothetical protein [Spirochaetales bacterium]